MTIVKKPEDLKERFDLKILSNCCGGRVYLRLYSDNFDRDLNAYIDEIDVLCNRCGCECEYSEESQ